ncbi:kinase-like domain-containing protein [Lyophyllum atratum]|nr:kinase-like domain-containing protein [Lyophyllum atratum]
MVAGPPSPSLAEISRNTSVISSSSSSSSTSSLVDAPPPRPTRVFAAPRSATDVAQSQSQAHLLPSYIQRELGIAGPSSPLRDATSGPTSRFRFNSPQDFEFGDILGHGSYSTVIQAKGKKSGRTYAIKVLDKAHLQRHNQRRTAYAEKESLVVLGLGHPGIVGLHSTFSDAWSLYFVLDLLPNGDLRALISRYGSLSLACTRYYMVQLVDALEYIHSKGVMHRDVKPENLLLDSRFRLALADFGTAKLLPPASPTPDNSEAASTLQRSNTFVGTPQYYSPELLAHSQTSPASDLWTLGCVLYELYTGTFVFNGPSPLLTWRLIKSLQYTFPEGFDDDARDLVSRLLVIEPEKRLGAGGEGEVNSTRALKAHPFFATVNWNTVWEDPHPPLESGLRLPAEPIPAPESDAELGAQLREERLLDQDDDEIAWAKDARVAAYLPGLRNANVANGNASISPTVVADSAHIHEENEDTTETTEQYVFPMVDGKGADGGLPYTFPPPPPAPTRNISAVARAGENATALAMPADATSLAEATAGLALDEPVTLDAVEGVPKSEPSANEEPSEADQEGTTVQNGNGPASASTKLRSTVPERAPSVSPDTNKSALPSDSTSSPSPTLAPPEFAHLLKPAERFRLSSPLMPEAHAPSFARLLPKLLSGSVRSKPKLKERVLLLTNRRVICASTGRSAVAIKQEFVFPLAGSTNGNGTGVAVIKGVEARGERGLVLQTNDKPVVYMLDDVAAPAGWVQQIRLILQGAESGLGSVSPRT